MTARPLASVIIPVHNGRELLDRSLRALAAGDLPRERWELVVVDDGSTDDAASAAAPFADTVVRLPGPPRGPSYARNRGVEVARGEYIVFVDSDVAVHSDTLRRLIDVLDGDPLVAAVFGSFDDDPPARGLVSQYWNLLQAYSCRVHAGEAWSFGAACGAIRRTAFVAVGGFDEWHFQAPLIEDLELGIRLREAHHRVVLRADIQATHLKRWTLRTMLRDAWGRGVLLGRLLGYGNTMRRARSDVLHTLTSATSVLAGLAALLVLTAARSMYPNWIAALLLSLGVAAAMNYSVNRFLIARRGALFTILVAPLHLAAEVTSAVAVTFGWLLRHLLGDPSPDPTTQAFAEVGVQTWPPIPKRR